MSSDAGRRQPDVLAGRLARLELQHVEIPQLHQISERLAGAHLAVPRFAVVEPIWQLYQPARTAAGDELETDLEAARLDDGPLGDVTADEEEPGRRVADRREIRRFMLAPWLSVDYGHAVSRRRFLVVVGEKITLPFAPTWTNSLALKLSLLSADVWAAGTGVSPSA